MKNKELKLFCYTDASGEEFYMTYYEEDDFYNHIVEDTMESFCDKITRQEAIKYIEECPYIHYCEIDLESEILVDYSSQCFENEEDYSNAIEINNDEDLVTIKAQHLLKYAYDGAEVAWCM